MTKEQYDGLLWFIQHDLNWIADLIRSGAQPTQIISELEDMQRSIAKKTGISDRRKRPVSPVITNFLKGLDPIK